MRIKVTKKDDPTRFFSVVSNDYGTTYDSYFFYGRNAAEGDDTAFSTSDPVILEISRDEVSRSTFAWVEDTDGGTISFNLAYSNKHRVTLAGDRTLEIVADSCFPGQVFMIKLIQDGTGGRTVTWFSTINWAGGTEPTLATDPGASDTFLFVQTGTDTYDGYLVGTFGP